MKHDGGAVHEDSASRLVETLGNLGVTWRPTEGQGEVLFEAGPNYEEISRAYGATNDLLRQQATGSRGLESVHITGEARALIDAAHRRVLRLAGAGGVVPVVGCHYEEGGGSDDAATFFQREGAFWKSPPWTDLVDVAAMVASGSVALVRLAEPAPIHYSLFGDDLVLLQDRHEHPSDLKRVWLVHSQDLHAELKPKAKAYLERGRRLDRAAFDAMLESIHSPEAIDLASDLEANESVERQASVEANALIAFGFVRSDENRLLLTESGRAWLGCLTEVKPSGEA